MAPDWKCRRRQYAPFAHLGLCSCSSSSCCSSACCCCSFRNFFIAYFSRCLRFILLPAPASHFHAALVGFCCHTQRMTLTLPASHVRSNVCASEPVCVCLCVCVSCVCVCNLQRLAFCVAFVAISQIVVENCVKKAARQSPTKSRS